MFHPGLGATLSCVKANGPRRVSLTRLTFIPFPQGGLAFAGAHRLADGSFDIVTSSTVSEEGNADRMLAELAPVTGPGGRIAVMVSAVDMPFLVNLPVRTELKSRQGSRWFTKGNQGGSPVSLERINGNRILGLSG